MMRNFYLLLLIAFSAVGVAQPCLDSTSYTGLATWYSSTSMGYCSFPVPSSPIYTVAMNPAQYDTAASCGACLEVTGPLGTVTVSVEDLCPACGTNAVDLSADAFNAIADSMAGVVAVYWHYVPCPLSGNIRLFISSASNPYYLNMQVRNHRYPIRQVEFKSNGSSYVTMTRGTDNMFTVTPPVVPATAPLSFRITDVLGQVIEETAIPFTTGTDISGTAQFPLCAVTDAGLIEGDKDALTIYPNPVESGPFAVECSNGFVGGNLEVTDVNGRLVYQSRVPNDHFSVDFWALPGVYNLRLSSANGVITRKVVKW